MRVTRWGDELLVRLPQSLVETLGLKEGDEVEVIARKQTGTARTQAEREEALQNLRKFRGWMPDDFKFDRDEANER